MSTARGNTLFYKRSHFVTHLPLEYRYSPAHSWISERPGRRWRLGLTKFSTRMLGEMVDHGFDIQEGAPVAPGQILGWIEGFKAISDLYCVASGSFAGGNPSLKQKINLVDKDPYGEGWLYEVEGTPDANCMGVHAYRDLLDETIDRILEKQKAEQIQ